MNASQKMEREFWKRKAHQAAEAAQRDPQGARQVIKEARRAIGALLRATK